MVLLNLPGSLAAQDPTDCANALPVCSNGNINESSNGGGINDFAFPNNYPGCLTTNEHQSVWLYLQIESGTTLNFDIRPNGTEDYDFAVYGPNVTCSNLGTPIRCSYAAPNFGYNTGVGNGANDQSEGASGDGYVQTIPVQPGQSYYVLVDNFSASFQGFTLTWGGNNNLDCSITEPCPEPDLGPDQLLCNGASTTIGAPTGPSDDYLWNTGATSATITVSDSGYYWVDATRGGCTVRDSIYITLGDSPAVDLGNDTILCAGDNLQLNATAPGAVSYQWQDGSTTPFFNVTSGGLYSVEVWNSEGCSATSSINVGYAPVPVVDLGPDTTLCDASSFQLNASTAGNNSYLWQDGSTMPVFSATSSGLYAVTVSNIACSSEDEIQVTFATSPDIDLGPDTTLCAGRTLVLDAFSPLGASYLWQDSSTDFTYAATETGLYSVSVSSATCTGGDAIFIEFLEYPIVELGPDTTVCDGTSLILDASSPAATGYAWQDGSSSAAFTVTQPGTYSVTAVNQFCPTTDEITVAFDNLPVFDLGPDTLLCKGTPYPLIINGESDYAYAWQDASSDTMYTVTEDGVYYVAVENQCGVVYDSIQVVYGSCNCDFFFPTGFTPNGDGLNDQFFPMFDCDSLQSYRLEVFNRWGERIFVTDNIEAAWLKGESGQQYPMDTYVWVVEYGWTWRGKRMDRRESGYISILR